ncbi:MAG: hypothetical protein HN742_29025 [Lentisphaerae bacterium]|nr:hypothetical protein [Lentisphaerota bacterium]MBT5609523.1 hypothetical protein [Lentisphaerota bacterium]MBT7058479.1 hypothetical protein [Lentisphaerota bacterium]MBT7845951.1 hypothetical protein [Lentisphaerota bacterium]
MTLHRLRSILIPLLAVAFMQAAGAPFEIDPGAANVVTFAPQKTRFVRFLMPESSGAQPCLDELEVYGVAPGKNLALAKHGGKVTASSELAGYAIHLIEHLNDGLYGNAHSWIAAGSRNEWAQVELPGVTVVQRLIFSRDRLGRYTDRLPASFVVQLSVDGKDWESVFRTDGVHVVPAVPNRPRRSTVRRISFRQHHARQLRVLILSTGDCSPPCLQEVEVYGRERGVNLALAENGATVRTSSVAQGSPALLNDGQHAYEGEWGAEHAAGQWVEVTFPTLVEVTQVVLSRDQKGQRDDGAPNVCEVLVAQDGMRWKRVAVHGRGVVGRPTPVPRVASPGVTVDSVTAPEHVPTVDALGFANLARGESAVVTASSILPGHAKIHAIPHLNDGQYGNRHSWISTGEPSWGQVDLGAERWVYKVALGSDSLGEYKDRAATRLRVLAGTPSPDDENGTWTVVAAYDGVPLNSRHEFAFVPIRVRAIRVEIQATSGGNARIDELEVYGSEGAIPLERVGDVADYPTDGGRDLHDAALDDAFLAEEVALLKTHGWADADPSLVDYLRVMEFPRRVPGDRLPCPPLALAPALDGVVDDVAWRGASRGVVRVADPRTFADGPLVEYELQAGHRDDELYLSVRTSRLLSGHIAVVSGGDWSGLGVVRLEGGKLVFSTYKSVVRNRHLHGEIEEDRPVIGGIGSDLCSIEMRLPKAWFPGWDTYGLRIGLGVGGRHTREYGNPVFLHPSGLRLRECKDVAGEVFQIEMAAGEAGPVRGILQASGASGTVFLLPGTSKRVEVLPESCAIGPLAAALFREDGTGIAYRLSLFRYDPEGRALRQMEELLPRLGRKGADVSRDRQEHARLVARWRSLPATRFALAHRRARVREARLSLRKLFLRDPDLAPVDRLLCVKRQNFEPSHNYSVILDARGGGGGSVVIADIPRDGERLLPQQATTTTLFESGQGIARNPMADFAAQRIYFAHCKAKGDYYRIYSVRPDGSGLTCLTRGPFHDYWPCPLPDGGLAFVSTRCRARFLCWRPQAAVLFRMEADGSGIRPLSHANLTEWAPSVMTDGRLIWTRSEYQDKGADHSHTLWSIRPDGSHPELVFGNTIVQPNGLANGREVPGTNEICATLISHFGDLNGPIVLVDRSKGRFDAEAITSLTPEVPWPGSWPREECFRDPVPISRDHVLCAYAPRRRFGIYVIDRYGNRELLYADPAISVVCPTPFGPVVTPPAVAPVAEAEDARDSESGEFFVQDVYAGLGPDVERGDVAYIRLNQEVRADLVRLENGTYQNDHQSFQDWYATPVHKVSGPFGWPSYVAKGSFGLIPVEPDGSVRFRAPAGKVLYFSVLDRDFNELQRMRSVVQLQPGEKRSCIGCHEPREAAPRLRVRPIAKGVTERQAATWEGSPFSYEDIVQPVLDANCVRCHGAKHVKRIDLRGVLDKEKVPVSYRTLISKGYVHYLNWSYKASPEKAEPKTFGVLRSKLWRTLDAGHHAVKLTRDETLRVKTWIDLNCPLWPDYIFRPDRPGGPALSQAGR